MFTKYSLEGEEIIATGNQLFPVASKWALKEDLKQVAYHKLQSHLCIQNMPLQNLDITNKKRRKDSRSMKVGCLMHVKYTYMERNAHGKMDSSVKVTIRIDFNSRGLLEITTHAAEMQKRLWLYISSCKGQ